MPYDPRSTNVGGNRGIDNNFSRNAPSEKFRIIGVDTFDGTDWVQDDVGTLPKAKEMADKQVEGTQMLVMYVYDDKGKHLYTGGTF